MGLIAGLSMKEIWRTAPGAIIDLFYIRREYDEHLHGIKRKKRKDGDWE
jgi:hypothetical protein